MAEKEQEITPVIEYFKSLRDEMHLRIREHTRLVWIKIVSLGAIISFLMATFYGKGPSTSPLFYLFWIIPVAAVIFDMLIAGNLRVINNLGYYVKNYIEGEVFNNIKGHIKEKILFKVEAKIKAGMEKELEEASKENAKRNVWRGEALKELKKEFKTNGFSLFRKATVKKEGDKWKITDEGREFIVRKEGEELNVYRPKFGFWEEKAAQAAPEYHCYTWPDMFVIWLFTLASWFFSLLLPRQQMSGPLGGWDISLAVICGAGVGFALYSLICSITMERRF